MASSEDEVDVSVDGAVFESAFGAVGEQGVLPAYEGAVCKCSIGILGPGKDSHCLTPHHPGGILARFCTVTQIIKVILNNQAIKACVVRTHRQRCACTGAEARFHSVVVVPDNFGTVANDMNVVPVDEDFLAENTVIRKLDREQIIGGSIENSIEVVARLGFYVHGLQYICFSASAYSPKSFLHSMFSANCSSLSTLRSLQPPRM